jgi:glyoxylase-like metal-dependent hydrolase (beta-lactamase superfamily II)
VLDPDQTAVTQIRRLGFAPADVRHIVLTHLDRDHAGGIADFPHATIHVSTTELEAASARGTAREQARYLPHLWAHHPQWQGHDLARGGDRWHGFDAVRPLPAIPEVVLIPLPGHTRGHIGVAVDASTRPGEHHWLLHAGDAYFFHGETRPHRPHCSPGLAWFQHRVQHDRDIRRRNQQRLRDLAADSRVTVFSAHDPVEFDKLATVSARN